MTPIEVARRYAVAWQAGDLEGILDAYADDIVLHWFGANPLAGEHRGKAAALEALARFAAATAREVVHIEAVLGSEGDRAAIVAVERWQHGGAPIEVRRVLLYRVDDGRFAECWVLDEDQRLVDEVLAAA